MSTQALVKAEPAVQNEPARFVAERLIAAAVEKGMPLETRGRTMTVGDMADDWDEAGMEMLALPREGRCGDVPGVCPYCLEEMAEDDGLEWDDGADEWRSATSR